MGRLSISFCVGVVLIPASALGGGPPSQSELRGIWTLVSIESRGKKTSITAIAWKFDGQRPVRLTKSGPLFTYHFKTDAMKTPMQPSAAGRFCGGEAGNCQCGCCEV